MLSKTDNRTDPIFQGTICTNSLNLGLTLKCSMRCPYCSVGVPKYKDDGSAKHASLADIIRDSLLLRPLRRVHLTGGEPMMHLNFENIAKSARQWFNCNYLTLETNGTYYWKYSHLLPLFDKVFITHYQKDAIYPGSPDNTEAIEDAQDNYGDLIIREEPIRHERSHEIYQIGLGAIEEDDPCSKYWNPGLPAGWYDGLLYRCCVSVGIDRRLGIPVTKDWRERIVEQRMGCNSCLYRGT